jgi:hypothetical protein
VQRHGRRTRPLEHGGFLVRNGTSESIVFSQSGTYHLATKPQSAEDLTVVVK